MFSGCVTTFMLWVSKTFPYLPSLNQQWFGYGEWDTKLLSQSLLNYHWSIKSWQNAETNLTIYWRRRCKLGFLSAYISKAIFYSGRVVCMHVCIKSLYAVPNKTFYAFEGYIGRNIICIRMFFINRYMCDFVCCIPLK